MSRRAAASVLLLPLLLAGAVVSLPAQAQQRLSLADRVAQLEQQANRPQQTVELLQQVNGLRNELQALRGQLEELQNAHTQEMAAAKAREQVLEARLARLEGNAPAAAATPVAATPTRPTAARPSAAATSGDDKAAYAAAFDTLKAGHYAESARQFRAFLDAHPASPLAGNAFYWLGESYYVTQNYALAEEQFRALLQRFPQHDKAPGALLKLGMTQMGLKQWDAAAASFREVQTRYPGSDVARTADDRLRSVQALRPR